MEEKKTSGGTEEEKISANVALVPTSFMSKTTTGKDPSLHSASKRKIRREEHGGRKGKENEGPSDPSISFIPGGDSRGGANKSAHGINSFQHERLVSVGRKGREGRSVAKKTNVKFDLRVGKEAGVDASEGSKIVQPGQKN